MSRAFHPPETLSKDDIRTIADVRREIWTNGMKGLGVGSLSGLTLYSMATIGHRLRVWTLSPSMLKNRNNMAFLSVLLGGAIGSFVMSVTTGKNQVHNLHPIFSIGSYQRDMLQEEEQETETISRHLSLKELSILQQQQQQQRESNNNDDDKNKTKSNNNNVIDRTQLAQNRLYRRASLAKKMQGPGVYNNNNNNNNGVTTSTTTSPIEDGRLLSDQEINRPSTTTQPPQQRSE